MNHCFVIPSFNEAQVIRSTIQEILAIAPDAQIVIVDDASVDDTAIQLIGLPVHYLRHPINLGQGAALQTGMEYALNLGVKHLITFDADGQHLATDALKMLELARQEQLAIVLGSRFLNLESQSLVPPVKQLLLKAAIHFTRLSTGLNLTDTHNGLRVLSRTAAQKIKITQNGMSHASQILSLVAKHKLNFKEFPTQVRYSSYSKAKGQKISNSVNIIWDLLLERLREL